MNKAIVPRISLIVILGLLGQPVSARDPTASVLQSETQKALFAGTSITLPFGGKNAAKPRAGLQLSTINSYGGYHAVSPQRSEPPPGVVVGLSRAGKLNLFVGGQRSKELEQRLALRSDTTPWLIAGGVAVLLIAAIAIGSAGGCLGPSMSRDC